MFILVDIFNLSLVVDIDSRLDGMISFIVFSLIIWTILHFWSCCYFAHLRICSYIAWICYCFSSQVKFDLQSAVTWLCFTPDSEQIITASKDGSIRIWNINGMSFNRCFSMCLNCGTSMVCPLIDISLCAWIRTTLEKLKK